MIPTLEAAFCCWICDDPLPHHQPIVEVQGGRARRYCWTCGNYCDVGNWAT